MLWVILAIYSVTHHILVEHLILKESRIRLWWLWNHFNFIYILSQRLNKISPEFNGFVNWQWVCGIFTIDYVTSSAWLYFQSSYTTGFQPWLSATLENNFQSIFLVITIEYVVWPPSSVMLLGDIIDIPLLNPISVIDRWTRRVLITC